jgi:hypothetical protein
MGILFATYTGNDQMDVIKGMATALVFTGVYLVTQKKKVT